MKKLTFYFLVSLFFITNVLADQLAVVDIKLGTKAYEEKVRLENEDKLTLH